MYLKMSSKRLPVILAACSRLSPNSVPPNSKFINVRTVENLNTVLSSVYIDADNNDKSAVITSITGMQQLHNMENLKQTCGNRPFSNIAGSQNLWPLAAVKKVKDAHIRRTNAVNVNVPLPLRI